MDIKEANNVVLQVQRLLRQTGHHRISSDLMMAFATASRNAVHDLKTAPTWMLVDELKNRQGVTHHFYLDEPYKIEGDGFATILVVID